jgi:predicted AAA+ superfamily ATPase
MRLAEALADTPVVFIHGPRQCGKTTLARIAGDRRGYSYFSFDDPAALAAARADPNGFVSELPARAILDEVQRAPELFIPLKLAVDRDRTPGRFLLTGSADVLLLPRVAESLAGRVEILRLHPLAQGEIAGRRPRFLIALFAGSFKTRRMDRLGLALAERVAAGATPRPSPVPRRADEPPGTATTSKRWSSATSASSVAFARWKCSPGS